MPWTSASAGSSRTRAATEASRATRCTLHTGEDLLTDRQRERLVTLFTHPDYVEVEATWGILQRMIAAYRHSGRAADRTAMAAVIDALRDGVPTALVELRRLAAP